MTKTSKTSEAFYALALGWELDEAQSLHAEADAAFRDSRLWEQVEAEGESVCLACFNG